MLDSIVALFRKKKEFIKVEDLEPKSLEKPNAPETKIPITVGSKNEKILLLLKQNTPVNIIAKDLRCSAQHVYWVRRNMLKKESK